MSSTSANSAEMRPWSDLPDGALHTILMHVSGVAAYAAFSCVCKSWRSVSKESILDFLATEPPMLHNIKDGFTTFLSLHRIYKRPLPPQMEYAGQFRGGYLIMKCRRTPVVFNLFTGANFEFPGITSPIMRGFLSAPPTSSDCVLWLVDSNDVRWCRVGGSEWCTLKRERAISSIAAGAAVSDKLYLSSMDGQVEFIEMGGHSGLMDAPAFQSFSTSQVEVMMVVLVEVGRELWMVAQCRSERPLILAYRLDLSTMRWENEANLGFNALFTTGDGRDRFHRGEVYNTRGGKGALVHKNCIYHSYCYYGHYMILYLDEKVKSITKYVPKGTVS